MFVVDIYCLYKDRRWLWAAYQTGVQVCGWNIQHRIKMLTLSTYQAFRRLYEGPVHAVHSVVETAGVTEIVT